VDLELRDRVVLVTGGSQGLGLAVAERLVHEGARVGICARDEARLQAAARQLAAVGGDVLAVPADVTAAGDAERFVDAALARWGRVEGLVNNAGAHAAGGFESITDEAWRADLDLKLMAAVRMTRAALSPLRTAEGAIVNVLNVFAKAPGAGTLPTSVSRAAGLALGKALSRELGPHGVRVNAVVVGFVKSGQWARLSAQTGKPEAELYEQFTRDLGIPIGRVGESHELADAVAYLLSRRASYITGAALNVDGGLCPVT
jgi:NAD(P)-dependent dehydrogenase (short-subunit alcohol dehydrogenase family)